MKHAHSIEQEKEKETLVEKNKVKGVIDEITSSIGNILEENFSGIIRDVEEINRLLEDQLYLNQCHEKTTS